MKNIDHIFDTVSYILMPKFPKQPSILKQIWYKYFKGINLLDIYRDELKEYYKGYYSGIQK